MEEAGPRAATSSVSDGEGHNARFPRRLSQCSSPAMALPGEDPPMPSDNFLKVSLTSLLASQEELKDVLAHVCTKLDNMQRILDPPERLRSHFGRFHATNSSEVKKVRSLRSQDGPGSQGASVASMSIDMFTLNSMHNKELLSKKKSFSVVNAQAVAPRKGVLKRFGSDLEIRQRRSSQASVKIVVPDDPSLSMSMPGQLEEAKEKEQENVSDSEDSVLEAGGEAVQRELHRSMGSVGARSPFASLADEPPLTPVASNGFSPVVPPSPGVRRDSKTLEVPTLRSHVMTAPGGLMLPKRSSQEESQVRTPSGRLPSTSSERATSKKTLTSLDSLRAQHNVKVLAQHSERMKEPISERDSEVDDVVEAEDLRGRSMNCFISIFLSFTGILDARPGTFWKCLAHLSIAKVLALGLFLFSSVGRFEDRRFSTLTTNCYSIGVVVSILLLRWGRPREDSLEVLLGPQEYQLDEYMCKRGFIESGRIMASMRGALLLTSWSLMVACRILSCYFGRPETGLITGDLLDYVEVTGFALASLTVTALLYVQLHVASALELSVDMFSAHFFDTKDIIAAMEEWNILQALIRCASCRIETSFMVLAASSLASLTLLAMEVWSRPELLHEPLPAMLWLGWVYPPVLLLLYSLTRSAAVSEKCSRVAPFINSWDFPAEDAYEGLHEGRQYIVQYIMQSEAGFYVKGVRLTNFTVMKLCYGFGALSFALLSHTMTAIVADAVRSNQ